MQNKLVIVYVKHAQNEPPDRIIVEYTGNASDAQINEILKVYNIDTNMVDYITLTSTNVRVIELG